MGEPDYHANSAQREAIINIWRTKVGLVAEEFYRSGEGRVEGIS